MRSEEKSPSSARGVFLRRCRFERSGYLSTQSNYFLRWYVSAVKELRRMATTSAVTTHTATVSRTKPHFVVLDGLRGVAAVGVVIFHFMEMAIWNYSKLWIGHGFLAVDFFFCLSGFVMAYAYDDRIGKMGLGQFFKVRLIRLQPLVVLGTLL